MLVRAVLGILLCAASVATQEVTFTYTSPGGKKLVGHFVCRGDNKDIASLIDEEGTQYNVPFEKIDSMVLTERKPPYSGKCSSWSKAVVTFSDGSTVQGCLGPYTIEFVTETVTISSVSTSKGKFVRNK